MLVHSTNISNQMYTLTHTLYNYTLLILGMSTPWKGASCLKGCIGQKPHFEYKLH